MRDSPLDRNAYLKKLPDLYTPSAQDHMMLFLFGTNFACAPDGYPVEELENCLGLKPHVDSNCIKIGRGDLD